MKIKEFLPSIFLTLGLFLTQLYAPNYTITCFSFFGIGIIMSALNQSERLFIRVLIVQLVITLFIYFRLALPNIGFLENTLNAINMPIYLLPIVFVFFNTLNAAVIVNLGSLMVSFFKKKN